jgi:hypothetical protein
VRLDPDSQLSFSYGARGFVQHGTDALPVLLGSQRLGVAGEPVRFDDVDMSQSASDAPAVAGAEDALPGSVSTDRVGPRQEDVAESAAKHGGE